MKTFLVALALSLSLATAQASSWTDWWCKNVGLGCPPPAQSIAIWPDGTGTSVPLAMSPNADERATYAQAAQLRGYLNAHLAAQILPGDDSANPGMLQGILGTFVPLFTGPGISPPSTVLGNVKYYFLHFLFDSGAPAMNVGLQVQKFAAFPNDPDYVLKQIAIDARTQLRGFSPASHDLRHYPSD